nr:MULTISPECIES: tyrosine-type recombinase/integrase [unclassified Paenibacillus]
MKLLKALENLKHQALLNVAYSAGLGVSEVVSLKVKDIDADRHLIHVRQSNGRKDQIYPALGGRVGGVKSLC